MGGDCGAGNVTVERGASTDATDVRATDVECVLMKVHDEGKQDKWFNALDLMDSEAWE